RIHVSHGVSQTGRLGGADPKVDGYTNLSAKLAGFIQERLGPIDRRHPAAALRKAASKRPRASSDIHDRLSDLADAMLAQSSEHGLRKPDAIATVVRGGLPEVNL